MSVSSILALVLAGVAAKTKSVQVARPPEDHAAHAVMKQMARELREAKARIAELEDDVARANIQYRRDQELIDIWRERALAADEAMRARCEAIAREWEPMSPSATAIARRISGLGAQLPAGPDFRPPSVAALQQQAQMYHQQAALAQYAQQSQQSQQLAQQNMQAAMNAQNYGLGAMGLLGAQNLQNPNAELWCNCVPSRAQVWAADRTE